MLDNISDTRIIYGIAIVIHFTYPSTGPRFYTRFLWENK